jgi:hypothetical protein
MKTITERLEEVLINEKGKSQINSDFQKKLQEIKEFKEKGFIQNQGFTILPVDTIGKKYYDSILNYAKNES